MPFTSWLAANSTFIASQVSFGMATRKPEVPTPLACGLYRTTQALYKNQEVVKADRLVFFHNHSQNGGAVIHLPQKNIDNRWIFQSVGHSIEQAYQASLIALRPEGLWRVGAHFHPDDEHVVDKDSLIQLGYNRSGQPILFFPEPIQGTNGFIFPLRGTQVPNKIYDTLQPMSVRGPHVPRKLH